MPPLDSSDGLADLRNALISYLSEVDADYHTCLRHEGATAVTEEARGLRLTRYFPRTRGASAYLRKAIATLPSWRKSPFWEADGDCLDALAMDAAARAHATGPPGCAFVVRGVAWRGRPILVSIRPAEAKLPLALDLLLPSLTRDLPELPLRRVAEGLRCHAHLLPDRVAAPLPLSAVPQPAPDTVRTYLQRATPPGLYASQCFSRRTEGH